MVGVEFILRGERGRGGPAILGTVGGGAQAGGGGGGGLLLGFFVRVSRYPLNFFPSTPQTTPVFF